MPSTKRQFIIATTAALWLGCVHAQSSSPLSGEQAPATSIAHANSTQRTAVKTKHIPANTGVTLLQITDFFERPIGPEGLQIRPALLAANGRQVQLTGYMVQQEQSEAGRFLLSPHPVQMSEHADGNADDLPPQWVLVELDASQSHWVVPYRRGPITLRGVLHVGRHERADGRIAWVRLQLPRNAVAQGRAATVTTASHTHRAHPH